MDIPSIGQAPPVTETPATGHGGGHGRMPHSAAAAGHGDTVVISHAARMAAQRAAQEEADAKARASKDAPKRRQPEPPPPPPENRKPREES